MKIYILSIVGAALLCAVVTSLSPDGKNGGIVKHVRLLAALALLCVIVGPALSFVKTLVNADFNSYISVPTDDLYSSSEKLFAEKLSEMNAAGLENEIEKCLASEFDINVNDMSVRAEYEASGDGVRFTRILVTLSGKAMFQNPHKIEDYVKTVTGLPCDCVL